MIRKFRSPVRAAVVLAAFAVAHSLPAAEADWLRWRGPNGDGISAEGGWNPKALAGTPKIAWKVKIGAGYSSVAVKGKHVYTMGHDKPNDVVYCLNIADGKEAWTFKYPAKPFQYHGPRAMPIVDGDLVYALGAEGQLYCLDAEKGKEKWTCHIAREHQAKPPTWGHAASPVIDGDWLILNTGVHGLVLNKKTGTKVWSSGPGTGGYATPVIYQDGNQKRLAIFGQKGVYGVDFKTGKKLWFHPWETGFDVHSSPQPAAGRRDHAGDVVQQGGARPPGERGG